MNKCPVCGAKAHLVYTILGAEWQWYAEALCILCSNWYDREMSKLGY